MLRWRPRRKALLALPEGEQLDPTLDEHGLLARLRLDLGQVISATPQLVYPNANWVESYNNQLPVSAARHVLVEYTSHEDAAFHLSGGAIIPVAEIEAGARADILAPVQPATQRVRLRVVPRGGGAPIAAKLHVHGAAGEYLAPEDRHRIINPAWFEDYSVDFVHRDLHPSTYINGETALRLPVGPVYVEVSKGFEVRPVRQVVDITPDTHEVVIEVDKVLPWRERGWVTADTHVHFLSPISALLEGAAEGVNIVNLLASQWGELMTNVGDFDGQTTWGARDAGGNGEYLVRRRRTASMSSATSRCSATAAHHRDDDRRPGRTAGRPVDVLLTRRSARRRAASWSRPTSTRAEHAASIAWRHRRAMTSGETFAASAPIRWPTGIAI